MVDGGLTARPERPVRLKKIRNRFQPATIHGEVEERVPRSDLASMAERAHCERSWPAELLVSSASQIPQIFLVIRQALVRLDQFRSLGFKVAPHGRDHTPAA